MNNNEIIESSAENANNQNATQLNVPIEHLTTNHNEITDFASSVNQLDDSRQKKYKLYKLNTMSSAFKKLKLLAVLWDKEESSVIEESIDFLFETVYIPQGLTNSSGPVKKSLNEPISLKSFKVESKDGQREKRVSIMNIAWDFKDHELIEAAINELFNCKFSVLHLN